MEPNDANAALPTAQRPFRVLVISGSQRKFILLSTGSAMVVGLVYIVVHLVMSGSTAGEWRERSQPLFVPRKRGWLG